jgi:hypothetical protein
MKIRAVPLAPVVAGVTPSAFIQTTAVYSVAGFTGTLRRTLL